MNLLSVLLQAQPAGEKNGYMMALFWGGIILVFYLFMFRPQMKKAKDQKKYLEALNKGDKIITIGGVHGKILELNDTTAIIEVEGGNRLKIQRSAISMEASAALAKSN